MIDEATRWDYPDIKRIRRIRDTRPISLPRKDAALWKLGKGIQFTLGDGTTVALQGWCRSEFPKQYWAVVYEGAAFRGEMRLVTVDGDNLMVSGERYRPDGKRAHADGSRCPTYYPCKSCWESPAKNAA